MSRPRKPQWLAALAAAGPSLSVRRCGTCGAWIIVDRDVVEERYEAGILDCQSAVLGMTWDGDDIVSIESTAGRIHLVTEPSPCDPDGAYLQSHCCWRTPEGGPPTPDTVPALYTTSPRTGRPVLRRAAS